MFVFAAQFARRHVFNAFWKTHNLYPLMYILMILHGIGHVLQPPMFYYFFLGPCVLFTLDMLVSVSRKKIEISVVKAELLPSGIEVLFKFFNIFLQILSICNNFRASYALILFKDIKIANLYSIGLVIIISIYNFRVSNSQLPFMEIKIAKT